MFNGSEYLYYGMYLVGFAIMMVVNLLTYKRYELSKKVAVIFTLITYVAGVSGAMIMGKIFSLVMMSVGGSGSRVAIYGALLFTPVFMITAALISSQPWRKIMDLLAPGIFIILTCAKFGCFLDGCCAGIECSFGIYNPRYELTMFPSQLFEAATMLIIVYICFRYAFKSKKYISGAVYPVTAICYSIMRFFWEFLRYYATDAERHIVGFLTFWQFCCIITIILSIVWILILKSDWLKKIEQKSEEKRNKKRLEKEKAEKKAMAANKNRKNKKKKKKH